MKQRPHTIVLIAAMAFVGGCSSDKPVAVMAAKAAAAAPVYATEPTPEFIATGPITVEQQMEMLAPRDGEIAIISADLGASVQKGQVLALFDQRQLAAERDAQLAKVRSIEADLKNWEAETHVQETDQQRAHQMWEAKLITQQELEHAKYKAEASAFEVQREVQNLNQAKAMLESLELELSKSRIVAPFSGVVARRYVTIGQKVAKNERLFWLSAMSPLQVKFMMPAEMLLKLKTGTQLSVVPDYASASAQDAQPARVIRMSPVIDPASGTFEVIAEIQGKGGSLKPGMTANIKLAAAAEKR